MVTSDCVVCVCYCCLDEPSTSGLQESDYPCTADTQLGQLQQLQGASHEIAPIKKIPLPAELVERFGRILSLVL